MNWSQLAKEEEPDLGFQESPPLGIFNMSPAGYNVSFYDNPKANYPGGGHGDKRWLNCNWIRNRAQALSLNPEISIATTIAHEAFHHALGGTKGHFDHSDKYVDSSSGKVGGNLSQQACNELCDELDID